MTNRFGIEIEFVGLGNDVSDIARKLARNTPSGNNHILFHGESYNHSTRNYWKVTTDSSVFTRERVQNTLEEIYASLTCNCESCREAARENFEHGTLCYGAELVSPILTYNNTSFDLVKNILTTLHSLGASTNETCGIHVHIDCSWLENYNSRTQRKFFVMLLEQYQKHEAKFDSFVSKNRRDNSNRYCQSMVNVSESNMFSDRYRKLNFQSFTRHKTVEFRQLHGTLNADTVIAWIKLCNTFTANVRRNFETTVLNLHNNEVGNPLFT